MKKRLVKIEWARKGHGYWHYFYLLDIKGFFVRLQGADDRETGDKHDGDVFWVPGSDIREIQEVE